MEPDGASAGKQMKEAELMYNWQGSNPTAHNLCYLEKFSQGGLSFLIRRISITRESVLYGQCDN